MRIELQPSSALTAAQRLLCTWLPPGTRSTNASQSAPAVSRSTRRSATGLQRAQPVLGRAACAIADRYPHRVEGAGPVHVDRLAEAHLLEGVPHGRVVDRDLGD